jgi:hypothetical protein
MTITNPGTTAAEWQARTKRSWLRVKPASGTLAAGESTRLTVTADRGRLAKGHYTTTVSITTAGGTDSATATMVVRPADLRVNLGGKQYRHRSQTWLADRKLGSGHHGRTGSAKVRKTKHKIARTTDDQLFRTRRVGGLGYRVKDLAAGRYTVRLGFVEYAKMRKGARTFNVVVDGRKVLKKYDIARHAKPYRAVWKKITVRHTGGTLSLALKGVHGKPVLSALRITEVD